MLAADEPFVFISTCEDDRVNASGDASVPQLKAPLTGPINQ